MPDYHLNFNNHEYEDEMSFFRENKPYAEKSGGFFRHGFSPEERKEERLFQKLKEEGRFGDIDKAKHNEQYKAYLLKNFDEFDDGGY